MSMLIETRNAYVDRLEKAKAERDSKIEEQVTAFRKTLEETTDSSEIVKLQEVIDSLNKVIAFEASSSSTDYAQPVEQRQHVEARAGMTGVFMPERR